MTRPHSPFSPPETLFFELFGGGVSREETKKEGKGKREEEGKKDKGKKEKGKRKKEEGKRKKEEGKRKGSFSYNHNRSRMASCR